MQVTARFGALLVLLSVAAGCLPTPIRRSAFVPRPTLPAQSGAPIGGEGVKAFAQVNSARLGSAELQTIQDLIGSIPFEGAAGLWIPKMQVGAGVYGAPNKNVEIGAQATYTRLEWADPNVLGVLEFPAEFDDQEIIMGGPGVRFNIPVTEGVEGKPPIVTPAFILETNLATIPQAVFVRTGEGIMVDAEGNVTAAQYEFVRIDRETFILPTLAAHVTVSPLEYVHILAMGGVQRGVKNIGFDPNIDNLESSTLEGYFYGFVGGGVEGRYEMMYATALVSGAVGQPKEIRFGLSGTFSLGVVFN